MRVLLVSLLLLAAAVPAAAQQPERLPAFVFDARGAFVVFKTDPITVKTLEITAADLPTHGFGIAGGGQWFPLRGASWAFGIGGELLLADRTRQRFDPQGTALGPEVNRRIQSWSTQISVNFGHRDGWSYLTGGIGPTTFESSLTGQIPDGLRSNMQNVGFGARWFSTPHTAFNIDMRFYLSSPAVATDHAGGRDRRAVMVLSAGVSVK